jgi:imidazolonepropionase-like amidohydrolase/Tol biopolymer transport system component
MNSSCRRVLLATILAAVAAPGLHAQTAAESDSAAATAARERTLPLITTRTLRFSTDEGTWMSLDVSPDGRTIVFELLGDLYTLPVEGGAATRITSGQAYDMQPRYSPDGASIVFISDRSGTENVWMSDADGGNARALTSEERENFVSPAWTPDGQYVVVTKGSQLWLYHTDGGSGVQLTGHGDESPFASTSLGAAFGGDARHLWFSRRGPVRDGFAAARHGHPTPEDDEPVALRSSPRRVGSYQVAQLDRETGRVHVRTHELEGAFRPVPSPDGRWLVYATRHDARPALKLRDLQTGEERWLVMDVQRDDHQGGGARDRDLYPGSAFTPDSRALITSYGGRIMRVEIASGRATTIPFTADVEKQLGPLVRFDYPINDSTLSVTQIRGARPSPDGRRIVFAALNRLWVADMPPAAAQQTPSDEAPSILRGARRLTTSSDVEHAPVWSPDGRYIAWVTWSDSTGGDIWRIRADGRGRPERLTRTSAFYDKLTYSADGSRLVAVRGSLLHRMRTLEDFGFHSGMAELEYVWLPAAGGVATRIAWVGSGGTQQGRNEPHIGPDPERIYVWGSREGLLSMRYDGTDVRTIVKVTAPPTPGAPPASPPPVPDEVVLSPDGTRALVRAARNVFLITVPPVGGEAPTVSLAGSSTVPTRRLTRVGGDFVGWSRDGRTAHYSVGRSFFQYDVQRADSLVRDSVATARRDAVSRARAGVAAPDTTAAAAEPSDSTVAATGDPAATSRGRAVYEAARYDVEITAQKDRPRGVVALRGARIITMRGDEVIENGDLVVRDNRIVAVGAQGSVTIPPDAHTVDVAGKTIMPGLVDIHAHTWVAWGVHRSQVSQFLAQLAYGVTTQRDPQTSSEDALTYGDMMELGELIGPRLYSTGPGVFSADNIRSLDDARDVLRRYAEHFNTQTIKQYMAGERKVRQWIITAARELGLTPTTEGGSNFSMNLTLMQDGYAGLEHALPISPFYGDVVRLAVESGITYTPTLIVAYGGPSGLDYYLTRVNVDAVERLRRFTPHDELDKWKDTRFFRDDQYVHPLHAQQLTKIVEAGGRVGLGSHGEVQGLGTHWELWMMASGGMRSHDALRAATLHSADAIGLAGDIGSLEPGKLADLQVLDANPLDDIHNTTSIRFVMKNGRLYDAASLTELWPRQRTLPTQWWWRLEPKAAN